MSSIQQTGRFLPFSNSNIQRKQLSTQGGLPQSLSGSDTDVSTSNENLSNEERYVIRHTARQEPQGQENQQQQSPSRSSSHKENIPNIQGNILNRNSLKDSLNGSNRNSLKESLNGSNRNSLKDSINGSNRNSLKDNLSSNRTSLGSNRSSLDVSTSSYNTLIIHNANDETSWTPTGRLSGIVREHGDMGYLYCEGGGKGHSNSPTMQSLSSLPHEEHLYDQPNGGGPGNGGCQEITDIPDDYLSQSQVLKHLAKEVKVPTAYGKLTGNSSTTPGGIEVRIRGQEVKQQGTDPGDFENRPPPNYTSTLLPLKSKRLLGLTEKLTLSRSQPDLSRIGKGDIDAYDPRTTSPRPQTKGREEIETAGTEIWPPSEMVQIVIQENSALKLELERCYNKVAKSQKLEQEIAKVHRAHEELAASCERREKLERAARLRLQNDCRRLTELNRALRDQIDLLSSRTDTPPIVESMRKELTQRELLIGQLITQNKELAAAKERQEIELAAQRATLQEQRTHIDILDTALTNAQGNVVRLEEESRKKQVYVERVGQLQRALSSLQASSDRREETERQLRGQLERELREGGEQSSSSSVGGETMAELKRKVRERDEKIMSLEGEVTKWEQRYLEESALRQAAIDAASLPKDAKIAALEKTSQDAEKLIAEARSEKMRHMDEVHAAQKKLADLESRMKDLESKLAERDAMIRVLQKHTYDKDSSSSSSGVGSYPAAHSSHSSTSADHHTGLTSTPELVSSVLGTASGYGSTGSYGVTDSYKYRKQGSFEQTNKSLDDQLKELDSQLLSKRALCCFPGFSNPGTASRKGKIPKPLLAGVDSAGSSSTASSKTRLLDDTGGATGGGGVGSAAIEMIPPTPTNTTTTTISATTSSSSSSPSTPSHNTTSTSTTVNNNNNNVNGTTSTGSSTGVGGGGGIIDFASSAGVRFKNSVVTRLSSDVCKPEEDMLLLEKQGRSSQRQRMQDNVDHHQHQHQHQLQGRRAGSLPPSSLPRPPRALKTTSSSSSSRYCRLSGDTVENTSISTTRKKSDPGMMLDSVAGLEYGRYQEAAKPRRKKPSDAHFVPNSLKKTSNVDYERLPSSDAHQDRKKAATLEVKHRETQGRSLIPPPSRRNINNNNNNHHHNNNNNNIGDYGRLSDGTDGKGTGLRKTSFLRGQSTASTLSSRSCGGGGRDSGGTASSDASTSSLPPTKARSIPRPNYRIQF